MKTKTFIKKDVTTSEVLATLDEISNYSKNANPEE